MHQFGGDRIAAEGRRDLQVREPLDPVAPCGDISAARRRRQRLGKAADLDYPFQPVERCEPRRRLLAEIAEDIVLDDRQSRLRGERQKTVGGRRRKSGAGRVVEAAIGDVEPRAVFLQRDCERREVGPRGCPRHADDLHPMGAQQRQEVKVARIVDQNRIARLDEEPAEHVDRLRAAFGQQDLVGRRHHPLIAHPRGEPLPERRMAERRAVVHHQADLGARKPAQRPAQFRLRHPWRGQPTAAGPQRLAPRLQRLPGYPQGVDGALQARADLGDRQRLRHARDVIARTRP